MGLLGAGIGALIGGRLHGTFGAIIGALLGNAIGSKLRSWFREGPAEALDAEQGSSRSSSFLSSLAAMMAKLTKLDGRITEDEIRAVNAIFQQLNLSEREYQYCIEEFRRAKDSDTSIFEYAAEFSRVQPNMQFRMILYEILWKLAVVDGAMHPAELEALQKLPFFLRIPSFCFRYEYAKFMPSGQGGGEYHYGPRSEARAQDSLEDDYELLGVPASASDADVKKAYREKAKKLHPDELASQGLPPHMENQANEQMARLNAAYDRIKKARTSNRRAGFTLLELLAVLGILSILAASVVNAVYSVQRHSRRTIARAEVRTVESALKAYLDYYGNWKHLLDNLPDEDRFQTGAVECFAIGEALGYALEGDSYLMRDSGETGTRAHGMNPDAVPFIEFSRHYRDSKKSNSLRFPINPWGDSNSLPQSESLGALKDARFFVAIDANCNGSITLPGNARFPEMGNGRLSRAVVVWTYNPQNTTDDAVVSWME